MTEHVDVVVVGAGISGIGAAHHLLTRCPDRTFTILDGRDDIGGTWDLFRYPGVRSDSDMHTLGYSFKPWTAEKSIADGPSILEYLNRIVDERGIRDKIRFNAKVVGADWYRIALPGRDAGYVHVSMLTGTKPDPQDGAPAAPAIAPADQAAWDAVKASTAKADFEAYLAKFPNGTFAAQAQAQIAALDAAAAAQAPQSPLADGTILLSPQVSQQLQDFLGDNRVLSGRKRAYFFVSVDGKAAGSFMCPDKCADHTGGGYLSEGTNMAYDELRRRAEKACKAQAKTECVLLYINLDERRSYRLAGQ